MKFKRSIIKWIVLSVLFIAATGAYVGYKMYNKPHRNVAGAAGLLVVADSLVSQYENNEIGSNAKYLDKVLEVKGVITDIAKNQKSENVITLKGTDMGGVICTLEGALPAAIKAGTAITLKGICTGYLTDVVLVRCTVQVN